MEQLLKSVEKMAERVLAEVEAQESHENKRHAIQSALLAIMFPRDFERFVN